MKTVICHSRKNFYNGRLIYWYEFVATKVIPCKFLRVDDTIYYEYGGTHKNAIKDLVKNRFVNIIEGDEI